MTTRDELPLSWFAEVLRASRLSDQWRIIYQIEGDTLFVERISPHDYRK